jgi:exonuclease SbcC
VIPIELELRNFLAYRDPGRLSFEGIHIACLAGPNGAGKSALLDAMTWALWGKARGSGPDELIHQGETEARVALVFEQGGVRYQVIRQRKGGKRGASLLELQVWDEAAGGWRGISEATLRGTQEKIEALLRLDYDTFVNSAFLMQGRADQFTKKTPMERKQVLSSILGLDRWEVYESRARERQVETRGEIQRLEGRLEEIERELARRSEHLEERERAAEAAERLGAQLEQAERQWSSLEQTRRDLVAMQRQIDDQTRRITGWERDTSEAEAELVRLRSRADQAALQAALEDVRKGLKELEPLQAQLTDVADRHAALAAEAASLRGANQALGPQTEPLKERAAILESSTDPACPTCGQPLTEDHRHRVLAELQQEIEARRQAFRLNANRVRELESQMIVLGEEQRSLTLRLREQPPLEKRAGELETALAHASEASEQIVALERKIARWRQERQQEAERREELERQAEASEALLRGAALTQDALDRIRLDKRMADERVGAARQQLAALDAFEAQRTERRRSLETCQADLSDFDMLREAFSKRGVPAMMIETAVPELERAANELLGRMTDGRLNVRIETQREIKTGDVREALDIIISDELGSRAYEMYSGGEAFRVNFAIRIALSRLLARRAGAQLRSLFIDEGFGTQDARGREQLVAAINSIQDDFDRILVITHIDELRDSFPARIEVVKTPQGSRFQLV